MKSEVYILKNELKEAMDQVNILENKVKVLDKEHAAEMLGRFISYPLSSEDAPVQIKELKEEALLDVFRDETRHPDIKVKAVQVLTGRQSPRLVSPVLELLNSTLDSHQDKELSLPIAGHLSDLVNLLGYICTQETYEGLKEYLNRLLLRENAELKDLLLTETVSSIARVSHELNKGDWVSLLKTSISRLGNEPETIKGILNRLPDELPDEMPGIDDFKGYLLELLENHEPRS